MKKPEAEQLVINTFIHEFSEEQFTTFIRNLLPGLEAPSTRTVPNAQIPQGFREHVRNYTRVGTYHDPNGDVLDVVIVKLKNQSSLDRARTRQRNLMAHYLNRREKDAVLVAYIADDPSDWRFSYVKLAFQTEITDQGKVKVNQEYTPARRFSFLVGEHEPNHTAQKQLGDLLMREDKPTLEQIEAAFNIESVTKEFFEDYKKLFLMIKENLDQIMEAKPQVQAEFEHCEIDTANFAKKLLGQIVFLYFLQKKGWLGVAKDQAWGTGDKKFLSNLFEQNKDMNFFDEILEPFFYEALAMERKGDFYPALQCKVPFLNGGLFEPLNEYDWEHISIGLDNKDFEEIFRVFNLYNFTVREDEPLEKEVAVDPEMLGKVFENLLEVKDRKSKGAFYTPREIVHYMCQESLINYLDTALNQKEKNLTKEDGIQSDLFGKKPEHQMVMKEKIYQEVIPLTDIEAFIREGELSIERDQAREEGKLGNDGYGLPESIRNHAKEIDFALADVKICDPAIGSGAFPVGMMTEIIRSRRVLSPYLHNQNNRDPYSLKWHCIENSLYGVDIDASAVEIAKLRLWLSLVVDEESYDNIRPLPNLEYRIVLGNSLLSADIEIFFKFNLFQDLQKKKSQYFLSTNKKNKEQLKKEISSLIVEILGNDGLFDFRVFFSEVVIDRNGFDIMIGNPPYVDSEIMTKIMPEERRLLSSQFLTTRGNWDYYIPFWESSIKKLNKTGSASLITPNKWLVTPYGKNLREFIVGLIDSIADFSSFRAFDQVGAFPIVVNVKKKQSSENIRIRQYSQGFNLVYRNSINRSLLVNQPMWGMVISEHMPLLLKLMETQVFLGNICSVENPCTVSEAYEILELLDSYEDPEDFDSKVAYKFINTGTIDPFMNYWGMKDTRYIKKRYLYPFVNKIDYSKKFNSIRTAQASSPKLIFSGMRYFEVFFDELGEWIAGKSTVIAKDFAGLYTGKLLLGILNSKIVKFFMYETYKFLGMDGGIGFSTTNISTIPLPILDNYIDDLLLIVDEILVEVSSKSHELKSVVSSNNYKILNKIIYQMYNLTEGEIKIVEENVKM